MNSIALEFWTFRQRRFRNIPGERLSAGGKNLGWYRILKPFNSPTELSPFSRH